MTKIKICGLKTLEDAQKVNLYLPEYIGFVFANTKRFVTDEQALMIKQALDKRIQAVGVFVDDSMDHIISLCSKNIIDIVQLHGNESEEYVKKLKNQTNTAVIKAIKVQSVKQVLHMMSEEADFLLFDTYKKGMYGGTGERFPLEVLKDSLSALLERNRRIKPYFLAGGFNSDNVEETIRQIGCYAVDVSTGVETNGVKDGVKIKRFIEKVRTIYSV